MAALADGAETLLPAELSALILEGASRLAATRKWRGTSQAEKAYVGQGYVSDLETAAARARRRPSNGSRARSTCR
jgi:hypothetical protein